MKPRGQTSTVKHAVIYCRSASEAQAGRGLKWQEAACREYAAQHGYEVVAAFSEYAGGHTLERPELQALLAFLSTRASNGTVVLVEDPTRLSRNAGQMIFLQSEFRTRNARLEVGGLSGATLEKVLDEIERRRAKRAGPLGRFSDLCRTGQDRVKSGWSQFQTTLRHP